MLFALFYTLIFPENAKLGTPSLWDTLNSTALQAYRIALGINIF